MQLLVVAPNPAMAATFSFRARRRRSCPPPRMKGSKSTGSRDDERADALGSADLVRGDREAVTGNEAKSIAKRLRGLHRIRMNHQTMLAGKLGHLRHGLHGTSFVVSSSAA